MYEKSKISFLHHSKQLRKAYRGDISFLVKSEPLPSPAYRLVSVSTFILPWCMCIHGIHVQITDYCRFDGEIIYLLYWVVQ